MHVGGKSLTDSLDGQQMLSFSGLHSERVAGLIWVACCSIISCFCGVVEKVVNLRLKLRYPWKNGGINKRWAQGDAILTSLLVLG